MICKPYSQSVVQYYEKVHGNIYCRQKSYDLQTLQSVVQYHDKMNGNAKLSSFLHILTHLHPAKTTLKHGAVDEIIHFCMFLMG